MISFDNTEYAFEYKNDKELKKAPEKLYKYPKPINVRANWEIEDIDLVF